MMIVKYFDLFSFEYFLLVEIIQKSYTELREREGVKTGEAERNTDWQTNLYRYMCMPRKMLSSSVRRRGRHFCLLGAGKLLWWLIIFIVAVFFFCLFCFVYFLMIAPDVIVVRTEASKCLKS